MMAVNCSGGPNKASMNNGRAMMKQIAAAFVKAKRDFGPALKDKNNPAFRSKYADLGACLEAVEPALLDNGIALYQETFEDGSGVTVETVLLHESGESIRCGKLHVPAAKQDPQGYGSALTYARRYSLMAACGIAPEDDDGNAASHPQKRAEPAKTADKPFDLPAVLAWIGKAKTIDEARTRGRTAWAKTADDAAHQAIAAAVEQHEQSALASA